MGWAGKQPIKNKNINGSGTVDGDPVLAVLAVLRQRSAARRLAQDLGLQLVGAHRALLQVARGARRLCVRQRVPSTDLQLQLHVRYMQYPNQD